ncbi:hypothetical protein D5S18_23575 [Nocardia panacis]|uniref:WXG100 family type VII secretion target n=1 Tax=Nocardia panacis TaxID=2340916 RepID=A0A3A4KE34_9NOCA|nr:hypothetical protein [Nocardia panacis]RJO72151.1 hypothetical protein D5S18_23575 [Nocardia panacis]
MGASVSVDPKKLSELGGKLRSSAAELKTHADEVGKRDFGSGQSGTAYAAEGNKIHQGLMNVSVWLKNWSSAVDATGASFVMAADSYTSFDDATVEKFNSTVPL